MTRYGVYVEEPWRGDDVVCVGHVAADDEEQGFYIAQGFHVRLRDSERMVLVPLENDNEAACCQLRILERAYIWRECEHVLKYLGLN